MLASAQHLRPVDEDVNHALAVLMRIAGNGMVLHQRRIEYGDIGEAAGLEITALAQLQIVGGQTGQAAHGVFQLDQAFIADVFADDAGEAAISARMRMITEEGALGRD